VNRLNRSIKTRGKLSVGEREAIFRMIAMYFTNDEIREFMVKECKRDISISRLKEFRYNQEFRGDINKAREEWTKLLLDVGISNKRKRLERLEKLYVKASSSSDNQVALRALSQAREEMEGKSKDEQTHYHVSMSYYNNWTDEDIEKRKLEIINSLQHINRRETDERT